MAFVPRNHGGKWLSKLEMSLPFLTFSSSFSKLFSPVPVELTVNNMTQKAPRVVFVINMTKISKMLGNKS